MKLRCGMLLAFLSVTLVQFGCGGGGVKRYHISGKVTHKGVPVTLGSVTFMPDPATNSTGAVGNAPIKNGAYDTRDGKGPSQGAYLVQVEGFDGKGTEDQPNGNPVFFWEDKAELPPQDSTKDFAVPANAPKSPPQQKAKPMIIP